MKLTIERAALLKALEPAQRVVERRNTIPILSNLRLSAQGSELLITGTDLDIELRSPAQAQIDEPGAITAPASQLYDIVRKLPEGVQILLEQQGDKAMTIRAGRFRSSVHTLPESDFPDITAGEMTTSFSLPAATLAALIENVAFAISTEETRYYLNGIYLHATTVDGAQLLAGVATDGHRLARHYAELPEGAAGMPNVIVPRKTVDEVGKLLAKAKGDVAVELSPTKIRLSLEAATLTSKLIDGTFPDYQRVIPQGNEHRVTLDTKAFAAAADRVSTISSERGRAVKLSFGDGRLVLTVTNPDSGEAREELDCDYEGPALDVGFNARYLAEILGTLGGDSTLMKLADPGSPAILQTREGSELLIVLMPMRV